MSTNDLQVLTLVSPVVLSPFDWQRPSMKPVVRTDKRSTGLSVKQRTEQALRNNTRYQQGSALA